MLVENGTEKQASYFLDGCPSYSETHELAGSVLSVPYDPSLKGGSVRSGPALTSNSFARTDSNRAWKTWLKEPFPRVPYPRIKWSHPGLARQKAFQAHILTFECLDSSTELTIYLGPPSLAGRVSPLPSSFPGASSLPMASLTSK